MCGGTGRGSGRGPPGAAVEVSARPAVRHRASTPAVAQADEGPPPGDLVLHEAGALEQLDLVGEGPHVLIAGTTGSGKSELLKTMLLSLCARYSPLELSMVLVDFKGGATFQRMDTLEHVLGVVTDLSQAAAERTPVSYTHLTLPTIYSV